MKKLNLGCGTKKLPGFVNVDIREFVQPDVVDDVQTLETFENDSVNLIYSCHCLEHFSRRDSFKVLQRWFDVLRPAGILRLAVPDIEACIEHYNQHKNLTFLQSMFWGSQRADNPYDYHYNGWTFFTLKKDLELIGFVNIHRWDWMTTEPHNYIDDYSQSFYPHLDKVNGVLLSLNVEATKPNV